jgi:hypothetical protein
VFLDHFAAEGLATEPRQLDGRSDYQSFLAAGIPAGGLSAGSDHIKTPAQAAIFGGVPGPMHPCYHLAARRALVRDGRSAAEEERLAARGS